MILELLALSLAAPAAATDPRQIYESLYRDLSSGKFDTKEEGGKLTACSVTKSTGDADLDGSFCTIARGCFADHPGNRKEVAICMDRKQGQFMRELAIKRASAPKGK